MARTAPVVAECVPHHITQRGDNRQHVFLLLEDRRLYLDLLRTKCHEHGVALLGYCLMTNQVHFVAIPDSPTPSPAFSARPTADIPWPHHLAHLARRFTTSVASPG